MKSKEKKKAILKCLKSNIQLEDLNLAILMEVMLNPDREEEVSLIKITMQTI